MLESANPTFGLARTAWKFFLPLFVLALILAFLKWWAAGIVVAILAAYILYFFRDPERRTPGIPNSLCSPADGVVASVVEVPAEEMPGGRARRIAVFLNIFNVHVQRSPVDGTVVKVLERPGRCMNALNEKCSEENEAVTIWLDTEFGKVGVRQITGAIARRIICYASVGDRLQRGQRYGIIQFGSRVEVFLPLDASVKVHVGQKVRGGLTCIAVLNEEEVRRGMSDSKAAPKLANSAAK